MTFGGGGHDLGRKMVMTLEETGYDLGEEMVMTLGEKWS